MLQAVPLDGRPAECLKSLADLAEQRPRWVLWKGVSDRLAPLVRAGVYGGRDLVNLLGILAQARVFYDRSPDPDPCWEPLASAAFELLEEAARSLTASLSSAVSELLPEDYGSLCESFLRLELHPSDDLAGAIAVAGSFAGDSSGTSVFQPLFSNAAFAWVFSMYQQRAPFQASHHAAALRALLCWRAPARWRISELSVVIKNAMLYAPFHSDADTSLHTLVLSAALRDLAKRRRGRGLTAPLARYIAYLRLCSGSRWTCISYTMKLRDLVAVFSHDSGSVFPPAEGSGTPSKVSGLEKDVQRVLDSLLRRANQARRDSDKPRLDIIPQVSVMPAMVIVDYVLAPDAMVWLDETIQVKHDL